MKVTCKNCKIDYTGNFCNNCGQSASVQRLDWKYTLKELRGGLIQYDKNKIITMKNLLVKPGITIKEFIDGKRVNHYKPFSLLLIVASLYLFLHHQFNVELFRQPEIIGSEVEKDSISFLYSWLNSHFSIATILTLPLYSVASYISFKNQGYNFTEHLVLNTYLGVQRIIVGITAFPLYYIYSDSPETSYINNLLIVINFGLLVWGYSQFFNMLTFRSSLLRTILSYIIFILSLTGLLFLIVRVLEITTAAGITGK